MAPTAVQRVGVHREHRPPAARSPLRRPGGSRESTTCRSRTRASTGGQLLGQPADADHVDHLGKPWCVPNHSALFAFYMINCLKHSIFEACFDCFHLEAGAIARRFRKIWNLRHSKQHPLMFHSYQDALHPVGPTLLPRHEEDPPKVRGVST